MNKKDCFHCAYAQSNEDGIHCYKKTRTKVKGTDTCEHQRSVGMTVRESYNFGVDTKAKQLYTETTNQGETMVEKRFRHNGSMIFDNKKPMNTIEVVDLLNELADENEQLKSRIKYLERKIERERNATNKQYEKWEKEALEKINKLEKENAFLTVEVEALKQIKSIRKLPRKLTVLKLDDGDVE